ncbi:MAG: ribonuclease P protein component [Alphaproteobacteria bacterium]|nr:ribonuclease P protein component [Alphaproteobacteria bacterium]
MAEPVARLKRRAEYLKVAGAGRKFVAPGLILQVLRQETERQESKEPGEATETASPLPEAPSQPLRLGLTASRKVGIAVQRNRARRRLRAAAAEILPVHASAGHDYVLIARAATVERPYQALVEDLRTALRRLGVYRDRPALVPDAPASKIPVSEAS